MLTPVSGPPDSSDSSQEQSSAGNRFIATYWGNLRQFEIPHSIFDKDHQLILKHGSLSVLLVMCEAAKNQYSRRKNQNINMADFTVTHEELIDRSGYTENVVTKAVADLREKRFLCPAPPRVRGKNGQYDPNVYTLCDPATGLALLNGSNLYFSNHLRYIKLPRCIVREHQERWSIARLKGSPLRLYIAICMLINNSKELNPVITQQLSRLKKASGLSTTRQVTDSLEVLESKGLIFVDGDQITLNNPMTGEPLTTPGDDPAKDATNYETEESSEGRGRKSKDWNLNDGDPEVVVRLLKNLGFHPEQQNSGELRVPCAFHIDLNPSLFVSPEKRTYYCHGCRAKGPLSKLVMQVRGVDYGQALQLIADAAGQKLAFKQPAPETDKNVESIYTYRDRQGKIVKQVLRYRNKEKFQQRRRSGGRWVYDTEGVRPVLYNLDLLHRARLVVVTEGEKDADTVMSLSLYDAADEVQGRQVIATTSGGANSWSDKLADDLIGKRVVIMGDNDEAGEQFVAAVAESLRRRNIEARVVKFAEAGVKDVTDYIEAGETGENLAAKIGADWVRTTELGLPKAAGQQAI